MNELKSQITPGAAYRHIEALDALRGFAAVYVFLFHAKVIPLFGQEAVILFFMLSGFVIYYVTHGNGRTVSISTYLNHRTRRIYPIFLFALLTAYVAASIIAGQIEDPRWGNLLENVFMFQGLKGWMGPHWARPYWDNSPLWSLSFEWWFYLMFIPLCLASKASPKAQFAQVSAISLIGFAVYQIYPHPAALICNFLAIWWLGVEFAREFTETGDITIRRQAAPILLVAASTALWGALSMVKVFGSETLRFGAEPIIEARLFGAAFAFVIVGFCWKWLKFRYYSTLLSPFAVLAPISYALYVIHYPVLRTMDAVLPDYPFVVRLLASALFLIPVCYALEVVAQRRINVWLNKLSGKSPGHAAQ